VGGITTCAEPTGWDGGTGRAYPFHDEDDGGDDGGHLWRARFRPSRRPRRTRSWCGKRASTCPSSRAIVAPDGFKAVVASGLIFPFADAFAFISAMISLGTNGQRLREFPAATLV
jgi:hypothetical protein